jgi:hypothetical protein
LLKRSSKKGDWKIDWIWVKYRTSTVKGAGPDEVVKKIGSPKAKYEKGKIRFYSIYVFFFLSTQYCQFNARETKNWEVFRFLSTLDPPPRFNNVSKKNQLLCKNACKLQCVFSYFIKNVADWFSIHKKWQATESAAVS